MPAGHITTRTACAISGTRCDGCCWLPRQHACLPWLSNPSSLGDCTCDALPTGWVCGAKRGGHVATGVLGTCRQATPRGVRVRSRCDVCCWLPRQHASKAGCVGQSGQGGGGYAHFRCVVHMPAAYLHKKRKGL